MGLVYVYYLPHAWFPRSEAGTHPVSSGRPSFPFETIPARKVLLHSAISETLDVEVPHVDAGYVPRKKIHIAN